MRRCALFIPRKTKTRNNGIPSISYRFAPRINAPGRLGNPEIAFDLLSTTNMEECHELAVEIEELNRQRREHESEALDNVLAECDRLEKEGASAFVVHGEFHQGVIGIIASRAVDMLRLVECRRASG